MTRRQDANIIVCNEEVRVGAGYDDDFWGVLSGIIGGGSEGGDEAGKVGGEFVVPEVEGRVVDGGAEDGA